MIDDGVSVVREENTSDAFVGPHVITQAVE